MKNRLISIIKNEVTHAVTNHTYNWRKDHNPTIIEGSPRVIELNIKANNILGRFNLSARYDLFQSEGLKSRYSIKLRDDVTKKIIINQFEIIYL